MARFELHQDEDVFGTHFEPGTYEVIDNHLVAEFRNRGYTDLDGGAGIEFGVGIEAPVGIVYPEGIEPPETETDAETETEGGDDEEADGASPTAGTFTTADLQPPLTEAAVPHGRSRKR